MWKIRPWERGFGGFAAAVQFDAAGCVLGEIPSASLRAGSRPTEENAGRRQTDKIAEFSNCTDAGFARDISNTPECRTEVALEEDINAGNGVAPIRAHFI